MTYFVDEFNKHFSIYEAKTDKLKEECFKIRYEVYCREKGWEKPLHPEVLVERDEYDPFSIHYLIKSNWFNIPVATSRLILSKNILLPVEKQFILDDLGVNREYFGELSRVCIISGLNNFIVEEAKEQVQHISTFLMACSFRSCLENNIHYGIGITKKSIMRQVKGKGIIWHQIGEPKEYHGLRLPCKIEIGTALNEIERLNKETYNIFMDTISAKIDESTCELLINKG